MEIKKICFLNKNKRAVILFSRVNFLSVLLIVSFKVLGFKVYYLTTQTIFNSNFSRNIFKKIGIFQLNYDDFPVKSPESKIDTYVNQASLEFSNALISENSLLLDINRRLGGGERDANALGILVSSYFNSLAIEASEMALFCNSLYESTGVRPILFCKKSHISNKILLISECNCRNLEPYFFLIIEYFSIFLYKFLLNFSHILLKFLKFIRTSTSLSPAKKNSNNGNFKLKEVQVAFFPHQGMLYESFFKKDQYYSQNRESPLFPEKILHLSYKDDVDSLSDSKNYYKSNNLPFIDFFDLTISHNIIVKDILWFMLRLLNGKSWVKVDFSIMVSVFMAFYSTRGSILRLKKLPKLKMVLYGYDVLFPKSVSYACRLLKISTAASQERHFFPWSESSLIVDYYFAIGPAAANQIRVNDRYDVGEVYTFGSPRLDEIYSQFCIIDDRKKLLNNCKFLSVVFDFHSSISEYENGRSYNNNWRSNREFYRVIIRAAKKFPEVMFLIKGKNSDFIQIPFFKDTVKKMNKMNNISIVIDSTEMSPYYYAAICDFSIAIYTSIADEIMQSYKPVLLYDGLDKDIPNSDIGFDSNIVVKNESDLVKKIELIVQNNYKNKALGMIYKPIKGSVKLKIKNQLTDIFNSM